MHGSSGSRCTPLPRSNASQRSPPASLLPAPQVREVYERITEKEVVPV